jgi:transcriptional regulator with XRE-family HTH domain
MSTGMSQRDCARALGVSFAQWNRWERGGQQPRYKYLQPIAELLGITVGELATDPPARRRRNVRLPRRAAR